MSYKRQLQAHYTNFVFAMRTISMPTWFSSVIFRSTLLVLVVFLSVAYVARVNSAATTGFKMHDLEKQAAVLGAEVQNYEIQVADAGSMNNIEKRLAGLNMIKSEKTKYIEKTSATVAKR